jgi:hypothetical protein
MLVQYLSMSRLLLVVCAVVGAVFGQEPSKTPRSTPLKEYSYASDGFAVKLPSAVDAHTDSIHSDFKVWTVHLSQRAAISIRLKPDSQPCDIALSKLKSMAASQNETIKEFSVSGRPAWEENEHVRGDSKLLERYVCGVGRYYVLSFAWPASESRPQLGMEVMDSFRLVK